MNIIRKILGSRGVQRLDSPAKSTSAAASDASQPRYQTILEINNSAGDPALAGDMPAAIQGALSGAYKANSERYGKDSIGAIKIKLQVGVDGKKEVLIFGASYDDVEGFGGNPAYEHFAHILGLSPFRPRQTSNMGDGILTLTWRTETWKEMLEGLNTAISPYAEINLSLYQGPEYTGTGSGKYR